MTKLRSVIQLPSLIVSGALASRRGGFARLSYCLILAGLGLLCVNSAGFAQVEVDAGQRALSQRNYPWYDTDTDSVRPLEFGDRAPAKSTDRNEIRLAKLKKRPVRTTGGAPALSSGLSWLAWIALGLVAVALIGLLIWAFFRIESQSTKKSSIAQRSLAESIEHLPFQLEQRTGDFRHLAQQSYAAGDFRRASVYLFSHVLVTLDQTNLIRLRKGKTNRQYLGELKNQVPLAEYYQQVMVPFEKVFFGDHDLTQQEFESCWLKLDGFQAYVNQNVSVNP